MKQVVFEAADGNKYSVPADKVFLKKVSTGYPATEATFVTLIGANLNFTVNKAVDLVVADLNA